LADLEARLALICLLLLSAQIRTVGAEEEEPVRVMCLGAVDNQVAPYISWFRQEPSITGHYVPSRFYESGWSGVFGERILRSVRMYFPRTYGQLVDYDFLILDSPVVSYFGDDGIRWMKRAIEEGEVGATTMNSLLSKHQFCFLPFLLSELSDCFPNDGIRVAEYSGGLGVEKLSMKIGTPYSGSFRVRLNRETPPVFTPFLGLGLENFVGGGGYLMFQRPGALVWIWSVGNHPEIAPEVPYLMSWEYGKGLTWSLSDNLRHGWWGWDMPAETHVVSENPYGLDVLVNWIRHGTGREPIQDIPVFHNLRTSYGYYDDLRGMVYSVIDFVSSFGGRTIELEMRVLGTDDTVRDSKLLYMKNELEAAQERVDLALAELRAITDDSVSLKDETFLWIYVTQWTVVTATGMICGFALWTLMVRRKIYRQVSTTRRSS